MTTHFARSVARILSPEEGFVRGGGFLVLGRYVVTCAHVVDEALGRTRGTKARPTEEVGIDLPFLGKPGLRGRVVAWRPMRPPAELLRDPVADVAVLELVGTEAIAGGLRREDVDRRVREGATFRTYGFPQGMDNGAAASGETLNSRFARRARRPGRGRGDPAQLDRSDRAASGRRRL